MIRPFRSLCALALALLGLSLGLASCSDSNSAAVTVNGTEISQQAFDDELDALIQYAEDHPDFPFAQQVQASQGEGDGTISSDFTAQALTERVIGLIINDEFEERDLELTEDDRQAAEDQFATQLGGPEQDAEIGQAAFDKFPEEFQEFEITLNAQVAKLREELAGDDAVSDEDVQAYYDDNPDQFRQNCVSHILVDDEATANQLRDEIEAGADFATVAEENSTDTGSAANGGDLGCQPPGSYVPEFEQAVADAEIGEVTEPVQSQFGFHLILVTDRQVQSFEEAEPQIRQQLEAQQEDPLTPLLQEAAQDADVDVNPKYGTWDPDTQAVVPPEGPTTTTTAIPTAPQGTVPVETVPPTTAP